MDKDFWGKSKVDYAIELLRKHEPPEGYYLATSYGKDSQCCDWLLCLSGVRFESHTNITGLDYPELIRFGMKYYPDTIRHLPKESIWSLIPRKLFPPTRRVRYCCSVLKESGGKGRTVVTGVREEESSKRKGRGPINFFNGKKIITPIYDWTEEDVWTFIEKEKLPYCSLYDDPGFSRLGCIMCPLATERQRRYEAERYPKYYQQYLRTFQKMLTMRDERGKKTIWKTPQDVMDWWLTGKAHEDTPWFND